MEIKILLANDEDLEDLFRQQFRRQILDHTYELIFVTDGTQALAALDIEQYHDLDTYLSDINMPGIDRLSLLAKVPNIIPILHLSNIAKESGDSTNTPVTAKQPCSDSTDAASSLHDIFVTV